MDAFDEGYEFASSYAASVPIGIGTEAWMSDVQVAIDELYEAMNSYSHYPSSVAAQKSLKGFLAEEWTSGTANIDAKVKRLDAKGARPNSHDLGSPDVVCGESEFQLKFLSDPKLAARKLATTLRDSYNARPKKYANLSFEEWSDVKGFFGRSENDLLYGNMKGIVPSDVLEDVRSYVYKRIERAKRRNLDDEISRWTKVSENLTDRIKTAEGIESRPATNREMGQKAVDVSNGRKLNPVDDGMTLAELISSHNALRQSLKAGGNAAALSAALSVAPEIYRAIDYLITEGELDGERLKAVGTAACSGAVNGFMTGSATAAITSAAARGVFGDAIKTAVMSSKGANAIASLVVLTLEACRNSYLVASGEIQPIEMAGNLAQSIFSTLTMIGGGAVAAALTSGAALPVLIGSFAGGAAGGIAFKPVSSCVMKVCVNSGMTFFGLIEQDYEVPNSLLAKLGIKGASVKEVTPRAASVAIARGSRIAPIELARLHTASVAFIERGFVGVNKISYS